jgi:hypothetical protein
MRRSAETAGAARASDDRQEKGNSMPDGHSSISAEALHGEAKPFLDLGWVAAMHAYTKAIGSITMPPAPPDQEGMVKEIRPGHPIPSVPDMMARAVKNAARWKPLLTEMTKVATEMRSYAKAGAITVEQIATKSEDVLAPEKWAKLSLDQRMKEKASLDRMIAGLQQLAKHHAASAEQKRDTVLAYQSDIEEDKATLDDIRVKYKDWLDAEDKVIEAWEKANNVEIGQTQKLIDLLGQEVSDFHTRYAGLAGGAGGSVVLNVVLPPLGFIFFLIAMGALTGEALKAKQRMEALQRDLERVQRLNAVRVFFDVADKHFVSMIEAIGKADRALGRIAGQWSTIAGDLEALRGSEMMGVGGLSGNNWDAPVDLLLKLGALESYSTLAKDCEFFPQNAFIPENGSTGTGRPN